MNGPRLATLWAALCIGVAIAAAPALAQERPLFRNGGPAVVELFTSQACDRCSQANRMIGDLAEEDEVIALTFAVDYWNYLGWRDTFAHSDFTQRQRLYRRSIGLRGLITPEAVVNGIRHTPARREADVAHLLEELAAAPLRPGPRITISRQNSRTSLAVGAGPAPSEPADVWVIAFDPGPVWQAVTGGLNRGRRVPHYNLVLDITRAGRWTGAPLNVERIRCSRNCAVLVQTPNGGPILAAARTPRRR